MVAAGTLDWENWELEQSWLLVWSGMLLRRMKLKSEGSQVNSALIYSFLSASSSFFY